MANIFCSDCKEEVTNCDECAVDFKEGDEIICHSFSHIHKDCVCNLDAEVVSEDDRYEP